MCLYAKKTINVRAQCHVKRWKVVAVVGLGDKIEKYQCISEDVFLFYA